MLAEAARSVPLSFSLFWSLSALILSQLLARALLFTSMNLYSSSADPSSVSEVHMGQEMEYEMSSPGAYSDALHSQHDLHGHAMYVDHSSYGNLLLRLFRCARIG